MKLLIFLLIKTLLSVADDSPNATALENSNSTLTQRNIGDEQEVKLCNNGHGECILYYQCQNGEFVTDGAGLIDIRIDDEDECNDIFLTCCGQNATVPSDFVKLPGQNKIEGKCGFRNKDGVGFKISGARDNETEYGEFPWMLAILNEVPIGDQIYNVFQCGASLITESVALTAAHCVFNKTFNMLKVRAGEWDTSTDKETFPHTEHLVNDIVIHEKYNDKNKQNDIALLILKSPVKIAETVNTVCLPPQDSKFDGKRCFVTGWGKDIFGKEGKNQVVLKKIDVPIVPFAKCQDELRRTRLGRRFILHESFVCAGGKDQDACKGDGGGPMVCEIDDHPGHYYQVGIVAWGIGCKTETPAVYTDVGKFRSWIDMKIHDKNLPTLGYVI